MSFENMAPHQGNLETFGLATRRVIRFSIGFLVIVLITAGFVLAGTNAVQRGTVDLSYPGTQAGLVLAMSALGLLTWVCLVGLLISTIVWIVSAHKVSPTGPGAAGYGGLFATLMLFSLSYLLPLTLLAGAGLRLLGWAALIAGVVLTRARIRRETGRPDLGGRPRTILSSDDWDASKWDPEVHRDIERRGRPTD
ncbi:hypothetical protein Q0Z83_105910 [Actinoplanes sichuanensis]|uniref:Uncharacterized protein n=1 Tax=Actinoplanes sichuanensis TaxID=512349 RepID=A0ABW4AJP7_9ACTN|nr:hypothetical protein [Actinoplanes sichuanensis]BEL12400.1 hypothetical protein Q0Z83_105910 [Actinoplanes sichuanensis]